MKLGRNQLCHCNSGKKFKLCHGRDVAAAPAGRLQPLGAAPTRPKRDQDAVIVLMPTRGSVSVETHQALTSHMYGVERIFATVARKPVIEARNELAAAALRVKDENPLGWEPRAWYCLWVDDDAWWAPGTVSRMLESIGRHREIDVLVGYFGMRKPWGPGLARRRANDEDSFPQIGKDCQIGDLVEVETAGAHFLLHRLSVLERVGSAPFSIPAGPSDVVGEDAAFCERVRGAGMRIFCDTAAHIAHVDVRDGAAYLPGAPALKVDGGKLKTTTAVHVAEGEIKEGERHTYGDGMDERIAEFEARRTSS